MAVGKAEGKAEGMLLSALVLKSFDNNFSADEIAIEQNIPINEVNTILKTFGKI